MRTGMRINKLLVDFSISSVRKLAITALIVALIPMLMISFYNHPNADDYSYTYAGYVTWTNTHNLFCVLRAALGRIPEFYTTWQGSYTAAALSSLAPSVFGEWGYLFCTPLIIGLLVFSVFYFCRKLFTLFSGTKEAADIAAAVICLIYTQKPVHAIQAFYWWNGAVNYVPVFCMMVIVSVIMAEMAYGKTVSKRAIVAGAILSFLASGGNPVVALVNAELMIVMLVAMVAQTRQMCMGG